MESNFKIHQSHLLNVQVSGFSLIPKSSVFNFISCSRSAPYLRASIRASSAVNKLHCLSLSSLAAEAAPVSLPEFSDEHSFVVSYLINSCGLTPEAALSKVRYLKFNTPEKPDTVLAFFEKHGFTKTQISNIIATYPRILMTPNPEKTHLPRLEFLSSIGLSSEEIISVIDKAPLILARGLVNFVIPSFNILRYLLGSDDKVIDVIRRYPSILCHGLEDEKIQILLEAGVPPSNIVVTLAYHRRGLKTSVDEYRKIVEKVKEMGFDPSSLKFLNAVGAMRSMRKSTWDSKVQVFKRYWSDRQILLAFEKCPHFITASEDKFIEVMDFLVNQMGVEAEAVANRPVIIALSLEKSIVPRSLIYQALLEKEMFKNRKKPKIISLLSYTKKKFYSSVIKPYEDEAPEILALYHQMIDS